MDKLSKKPKIIVIGVDGGTFDLISPWAFEGRLPNFQRLMAEGSWGRLQSTNPPLTPCAWTSFKTGVNPGKHGVYDFYSLDENRELQVNYSRDRGFPSIWQIISNLGLRSCVYNVPFTFPPEKVNGILISGLLTPSVRSNFTYPPDFKKDLLGAIPDYRIFPESRYSERESDIRAFYDDLIELIDIRYRTARFLLEREPWDFFMMVFNETDFVQHWYWKYIDPDHPDFSEEGRARHGGKIFEVYRRIDEHLGRFLEFAGDETLFLVISDHGAGRFIKRMYVNNWLRRERYLHLKRTPKVIFKRLLYWMGLHPQAAVNLAFKLGIASYSSKISYQQRKVFLSRLGFTFDDVDWKRTNAFSYGCYGPIFLNSMENSHLGIVPDDEVKTLRQEIAAKLMEIVDPERSGVKLVDRVWTREELYSGPLARLLPDLIYSLDNFSYTSSTLFAIPSNDIFSKPLTRKSGDHRIDGVFIAYGKGVKRGYTLDKPNILDVAPTILEYFGIEVPQEMDGTPLREIYA